MASLHDRALRGEPLSFKDRCFNKFVDHGHLAQSPHHHMCLWSAMMAFADDEGLFKPDYPYLESKLPFGEQELRRAAQEMTARKLVKFEGENLRLMEPPDNWEFQRRLGRLERLHQLTDEEEEEG